MNSAWQQTEKVVLVYTSCMKARLSPQVCYYQDLKRVDIQDAGRPSVQDKVPHVTQEGWRTGDGAAGVHPVYRRRWKASVRTPPPGLGGKGARPPPLRPAGAGRWHYKGRDP